jgi:hypothetical protein
MQDPTMTAAAQQTIQTATSSFFVPVVLAWALVFVGLELGRRWLPRIWPCALASPSKRPWLDVGVALLVAAAILGLGQLWHSGALDWQWPGRWRHLAFALAQALIWSPLPIALWLRRQTAASAWTGADALLVRLCAGVVLGALAITVFLAMRGELSRWGEIATKALTLRSLAHALPIYLEGVGLAFLFVRLQWALGSLTAALVPAGLFALAHVPGSLAAGDTTGSIVGFFAFNLLFVAVLLRLLARHRDVVTLGAAHWLMDLAIAAF